MSNTVMSYIQVLDGGTLTVEDVNRAVYGEHRLPEDNGKPNYYSAHYVGNNSPWIKIRTKWGAPVGAIAQLAYARNLNVVMEFDSLDNSEVGSMQFFHKRVALEDADLTLIDYYRPGTAPREVLDQAAQSIRRMNEETTATFGVEEAK